MIVPEPGHKLVVEELHAGHQGISRMKRLARSFVSCGGLSWMQT